MPTRFKTNFFRLNDEDEFEDLVRDICAREWADPTTRRFGRRGQKQFGVDVYGQPRELEGSSLEGNYRAAQCKLRPKQTQLTEAEIEKEVGEARNFPHKLERLIIATDTPRDTDTQVIVDRISDREVREGRFNVEIWFWPEITQRLATYPHLLIKYYRDYLASLTNVETAERLVNRPIHIVCQGEFTDAPGISLRERLNLRGVNVLSEDSMRGGPRSLDASWLPPDGLLCLIWGNKQPSASNTLLSTVAAVVSLERQVEAVCPVFIVCPTPASEEVKEHLQTLHGRVDRFHIISDALPPDAAADLIFRDAFSYGYERRGSLPTVEITARTTANKPNNALLDLDWRSRLDIEHHPSEQEWYSLFVPALKSVAEQLTQIKDTSRIQVDSHLPLPASVALGFHLNLRVATLGVWARDVGKRDIRRLWLSDIDPEEIAVTEILFREEESRSGSAILEVTSGLSIHSTVKAFVAEHAIPADTWRQIMLKNGNGKPMNLDGASAIAYASYIGALVRRLNEQEITDFHLFLRLPTPLGVLIGQKLQACGRVHLYWFDNANYSYKFAFTLK